MLALWLIAMLQAVPPPIVDPIPPARTLIAPARIDDALEIAGEDIAARTLHSRLTIPVVVNGTGPFRFIVDSGADRSVIGRALATRLGLPPGRSVTLHSMAGSSRVDTVRIDTLAIGNSSMETLSVPALDEASIGADGLIGIDALADQRLQIDFDRKTVVVQDSRRGEGALGSDEIVVIARRRRGQLILTEAAVRSIRISAVIDTGAQISVGNDALRRRLDLTGRRAPKDKVTLIGVTGEAIEADLIVVPEIVVGSLRLLGVPVAFVEAKPFALFGLGGEPAMLLGTDVLQAFRRVALDFRGRRVRFTLKR